MSIEFIRRKDIPDSAVSIGTIEASETIKETPGAGREPLQGLDDRVRKQAIKTAEMEHGTDQQLYLVMQWYTVMPVDGGKIEGVNCQVYKG